MERGQLYVRLYLFPMEIAAAGHMQAVFSCQPQIGRLLGRGVLGVVALQCIQAPGCELFDQPFQGGILQAQLIGVGQGCRRRL